MLCWFFEVNFKLQITWRQKSILQILLSQNICVFTILHKIIKITVNMEFVITNKHLPVYTKYKLDFWREKTEW